MVALWRVAFVPLAPSLGLVALEAFEALVALVALEGALGGGDRLGGGGGGSGGGDGGGGGGGDGGGEDNGDGCLDDYYDRVLVLSGVDVRPATVDLMRGAKGVRRTASCVRRC